MNIFNKICVSHTHGKLLSISETKKTKVELYHFYYEKIFFLFLRYLFPPNRSIESVHSQTKSQLTFATIWKLMLKFIRKLKGSRIDKLVLEWRKLKDSHYLISILNSKAKVRQLSIGIMHTDQWNRKPRNKSTHMLTISI